MAAFGGSWMTGRKWVAEHSWEKITALTTVAMAVVTQSQTK
jgi:2-keto-3-deoxy-6-phosphogluconate aldolase